MTLGLISPLALPSAQANIICENVAKREVSIQFEQGVVKINSPEALQTFDDAEALSRALKLRGPEREEALKQFMTPAPSARWERALVFANYAMSMKIAYDLLLRYTENPHAVAAAIVAVPISMFGADFMSSMLHKFFDAYAPNSSGVLGQAARSFRLHHDFPTDMNNFTYMQNVTHFSKLMAPLYVATMATTATMSDSATATATGTGVLLSLLLFSNGNELHVQAHRGNKASGWAKTLQKMKLSLSPAAHALHHRGAIDTDYGIINGWSNSSTRKMWKALDLVYWKALKKMPENWIENSQTIPDSVLEELKEDISQVPQDVFIHLANQKNKDPRMDDIVRLYLEHQLEEEPPQ